MHQELINKIKNCKSMKELDFLREELMQEMLRLGVIRYQEIQKIFIKQKNKLLRIPLKDRLK